MIRMQGQEKTFQRETMQAILKESKKLGEMLDRRIGFNLSIILD